MPNDIPYWVASIGAEVRLRSKDARTNAHSIRVNELLVEIEARETALRHRLTLDAVVAPAKLTAATLDDAAG